MTKRFGIVDKARAVTTVDEVSHIRSQINSHEFRFMQGKTKRKVERILNLHEQSGNLTANGDDRKKQKQKKPQKVWDGRNKSLA